MPNRLSLTAPRSGETYEEGQIDHTKHGGDEMLVIVACFRHLFRPLHRLSPARTADNAAASDMKVRTKVPGLRLRKACHIGRLGCHVRGPSSLVDPTCSSVCES